MKTLLVCFLAGRADFAARRFIIPCSRRDGRSIFLIILMVCGLLLPQVTTAGTWAPLVNQAPDNIDTMILLSDGTVMAASGTTSSGNIGNVWYRLTPDIHGSYANGKWTTLAAMNDTRLYYASEVLQDGRLFIAGAEYGTGSGTAEIYDPLNNTWIRLPDPGTTMLDCESRLLPNGNVLVAPVFPAQPGATLIYNPFLNAWLTGGSIVRGFSLDEASWIKLPDDSILTLDTPGTGTNSERYIPQLNQWVSDADLPVTVWDLVKFEMGPGFLLPDGRGFYLGSSGHTAFYTPSGTTSPGSWTSGPDIPNGQGTPDAPGAMMVTGNILCAVGPNGTVGGATNYPGPTVFYEFDPVANVFNPVLTPNGLPDQDPPFVSRMLCLPDGSVLFSHSDPQLYVYRPAGNPVASGKPHIISITPNPDGSFHLTGTLLNGISEGAQYGDDAQMNSNYPLIRMVDGQGNVFYARTFGWSSTSVMTGATVLGTEFVVPAGVPPGTYSLVAVANGISSDPVPFTGSPTPDLEITGTSVTGGNGNGIVDVNECNSFFISLTNSGATNATSVQATLFTSTPGVTIAQATALYPDIAVGGVATNINPFEISTSPAFVCGTTISLTLVVKSQQSTATRIFSIPSGVVGTPIEYDNNSPTNIPPNGTGAGSVINVTNFNSSLLHVTVSAFVFDSFDFDLTLQLIGPDGTKVTLSQNNGGSGQNYGIDCTKIDRTTFDDNGPVSILNGQAPFIGTFKPQIPLGAFIGKSGTNVNGNWQLRAVDPFQGDFGTIECWSLSLTPALCVDGGGQCPGTDLAVGMVAIPNPVTIQSNLTYIISVTNFGPDTATSVALNQSLSSSVSFVSVVPSQGSATFTNGTVNCNIGTLLVGSNATVTVIVMPQTPGTIFSTATVGSVQPDPNIANNSVTVSSLVVSPSADLNVSLVANPNPVLLNGLLTYTASVLNRGPSIASNVLVTNTLPLNVSLVSTTVSQGTAASAANVVVASLGDLLPGSNAVVTMQVHPEVLGQITAISVASSSQLDPNLANNTSVSKVTVTAASDLALTMTGPASVVVGSNAVYTVNVLNLGPSAATGVNLRDTLPSTGIVLSTNAPLGSSISVAGGVLNCLISNLPVNSNATLTLTIGTSNLVNQAPVTMVNSASVTASQADPNTTNNSASISTIVTFPVVTVVGAGFQLVGESFVPTNGMIEPGEQVTLLFRLQNLGNIDTGPNLTAALLSTGGVTPANGSQVENYGTLAANGPAVTQPFAFTASGTNGGTITASLQIKNNNTNLTTLNFPFTLALSNSFANNNDIIIPDHGPGVPFPSTNVVSGLTGIIGKVTVTFTNFNHTFPDDVDMLLVGPKGQNVLLMSHAGNGGILTNTPIVFDQSVTNADGSPKLLPSSQITPGSYEPSQYGTVDFNNNFNGTIIIPTNNPPPSQPFGTNLDIFNGTSPNGSWFLYVFDSSVGDQGIIKGGWRLGITYGTTVNPVVDVGVSGTASPSPVLDGNTLTYTFSVTNHGPNTASVVQFTNLLPANVTFVSATNSAHTVTSTNGGGAVFCTFTNLASGTSATVTVVVVPNAPGTLSSVATVAGSDSDPNQSNNSFTVNTIANAPIADLVMSMTGATTAVTGSNVLYTINVTNNGPGTAFGVVVTDALGQLSFVSGTAAGSAGSPTFNVTGTAVTCNVGNLAAGASETISLFLASAQAITNINTATAATASTDPNPTNNTGSVTTVFTTPVPIIVAGNTRLVSGNANGSLIPGGTATVSLALANIGSADTTNLVATLLAGNGVVSPSGPQNYGALVHGGPAVANNFTFTAVGGNGGAIIASLQLNDNGDDLGTVSFTFNLPATNSFSSGSGIIIPDHGAGSPYPSIITVTNLAGVVTRASLTLSNYSHSFPNDVEILLAAPSGQNIVLEAHNGGGHSITNVTLTFDDAASTSLPESTTLGTSSLGTDTIVSGTFKPTDDGLGLPFPNPAPSSTTGTALSSFNATVPNGDWALYVFDNSPGDDGNIGGWTLNLSSISPVNSASDIGITIAPPAGSFFPGVPLALNINVANKGPANANNVTVTNTLPAGLNFAGTSAGNFTAVPAGSFIFNLGTINSGSSSNFTVTVTPSGSGVFATTASVGSDQTDLNLSDNTAQASIQVLPAPTLDVKAATVNGAFALTISINGQAGIYNIVASTDLSVPLNSWTVIGTITNSVTSFQFTDTNAVNYPSRYYRAVLVP